MRRMTRRRRRKLIKRIHKIITVSVMILWVFMAIRGIILFNLSMPDSYRAWLVFIGGIMCLLIYLDPEDKDE